MEQCCRVFNCRYKRRGNHHMGLRSGLSRVPFGTSRTLWPSLSLRPFLTPRTLRSILPGWSNWPLSARGPSFPSVSPWAPFSRCSGRPLRSRDTDFVFRGTNLIGGDRLDVLWQHFTNISQSHRLACIGRNIPSWSFSSRLAYLFWDSLSQNWCKPTVSNLILYAFFHLTFASFCCLWIN